MLSALTTGRLRLCNRANRSTISAHLIGGHKVHLHSRVHGQHVRQGAHGAAVGLRAAGERKVGSTGGTSGAAGTML